MVSFYYLIATVFLVCSSTRTFAQENSTVQQGNNTFIGCKINTKASNTASNSTGCKLRLVNQSKISDVLSKHENSPVTNTVNIHVFVVPGKKTRYRQELELPWANEIGRNVISLIRRGKDSIFTSPLITFMLEVGIVEENIKVQEKIDGCLPPGDKGSDLIFDFLLRQLSRSDDKNDKHTFKLCKVHDDESTHIATYNCCRIIGDTNLPVCGDYSSIVINMAVPIITVVFLISFFMVLPFVFEHVISYPTVEFYKTSESHMSLSSILSRVFFEGRGPAKSFFRRCVFAGFSSLVFLPEFFGHSWLQWLFITWLVLFVIFNDSEMTNEVCKQECIQQRQTLGGPHNSPDQCENNPTETCSQMSNEQACEKQCIRPRWGEKLIFCFTVPFYFISRKIEENCKWFYEQSGNSRTLCYLLCNSFFDSVKGFVFLLITLLAFIVYSLLVVMLLLKFTFFDLPVYFVWPRHQYSTRFQKFLCPLRFLTLANCVLFTGMIFILVLSVVIGLTLNGQYFNPYVAPIFAFIIYLWKNWKVSVEAKCLQLKTQIIKICMKKIIPEGRPKTGTKANENVNKPNDNYPELVDLLCSCVRDTTTNPHTWKNCCGGCCADCGGGCCGGSCGGFCRGSCGGFCRSCCGGCCGCCCGNRDQVTAKKEDTIEFDEYGEAMISAKLYEDVRKRILPLDHILFHFFKRLIFVGLYVVGMLIVMIVARDAGVPETVQVISGIVGALIPFIFDTILADQDSSHKKSEVTAMKEKIRHIVQPEKGENATIIVNLLTGTDSSKEGTQEASTSGPK